MILAARFCMALLLALCGALLAYFLAPNILALLLPESIGKLISVLLVLVAAFVFCWKKTAFFHDANALKIKKTRIAIGLFMLAAFLLCLLLAIAVYQQYWLADAEAASVYFYLLIIAWPVYLLLIAAGTVFLQLAHKQYQVQNHLNH